MCARRSRLPTPSAFCLQRMTQSVQHVPRTTESGKSLPLYFLQDSIYFVAAQRLFFISRVFYVKRYDQIRCT